MIEFFLRKKNFLQEYIDGPERPPEVPLLEILKLNTPEWPYVLIGTLASMVMGFATPVFSVVFGDIMGVSEPFCFLI